MYIENATLKPVRANSALFPISAGTVLTRGGNVATGADAYGIVPQNVEIPPITGTISVAVAGKVDLMHPANKGISISDSIMDALDIDFVPRLDGKVPTMQQSDAGKVLTAGADKTASWQDAVAPTPEAADSGKVLTAGADGSASWQPPSVGGGVLEVVITPDGATGTADHTFAEVKAAVQAGKYVFFSIYGNEIAVGQPPVVYNPSVGMLAESVQGYCVNYTSSESGYTVSVYIVTITADSVAVSGNDVAILPSI